MYVAYIYIQTCKTIMIINSNIENAIDMHAVPNPLRYFDLFSHPLKPEVLAHKA